MTIVDVVRLLRRSWRLVALMALAGVLVAAAYAFTRPVTYVATSLGLVTVGDNPSLGSSANGSDPAEKRAGVYIALLGSRAVVDRTNQELASKGKPAAGQGAVSGVVVANTSFIKLTATGSSAENAQALANATLVALTDEALRMDTYSQVQGKDLPSSDLTKLTSAHILAYEPALLPVAPQRTNLPLMLLIGLGGGLALGAISAVVRHQFDVRVRTQQHVEESTSGSVLGIIPDTKDLKSQRSAGAVGSLGHAGESFRQLRTNLRFVGVDEPPRSVVITSAGPGQGKSTVATNLAQMIAKSGRDVVLIDCDLRKPMQARAFGIDGQVGLTQVLAGDVPLRDALVETSVGRLKLLPAGRIPPNPSELLGSQRMQEVLEELSRDAFVILDTPPLLMVTDAGLLSVSADGAILVAVVGKTSKDELALCAKQLSHLGATLLGTVLNRAPRNGLGDVLYGYGGGKYGYGYGYGYGGGKGSGRHGVVEAEVQADAAAGALIEVAVPASVVKPLPRRSLDAEPAAVFMLEDEPADPR